MSALLEARDLSFAYGREEVLYGVDVTLAAGEVLALIGPNGSGKSTLIRVLLGNLRGTGSIQWEGREVRAWKRRELARRVAYLPQSPTAEADQRIGEILRLGRAPYWRAFGIESDADARVVREVSALLGLDELLERRIDEVSGGQRQRVFIGRCLVQEPRAMLLDEPTTFLDLRHQVEICELLRKLARERSIAVMMASHDLNLAAAFADRLILLGDGQVAGSGQAEEVLRVELLSKVYGVELERVDREAGGVVVLPKALRREISPGKNQEGA